MLGIKFLIVDKFEKKKTPVLVKPINNILGYGRSESEMYVCYKISLKCTRTQAARAVQRVVLIREEYTKCTLCI